MPGGCSTIPGPGEMLGVSLRAELCVLTRCDGSMGGRSLAPLQLAKRWDPVYPPGDADETHVLVG